MNKQDIIKLLPADVETYRRRLKTIEEDGFNKDFMKVFYRVYEAISTLSKITIPEMATKEEIEMEIRKLNQERGLLYPTEIADTLLNKIPKPEGKGLLQQKYAARCKELEDKLKQASNGAQFRRVEEQQKEIERLKAIIAQDYTAGRMTELEDKIDEYRVALEKMIGRYNKIQNIMRKHGLKYDNSEDPMQKLFFTTYTELCEMEETAREALKVTKGE